MADNGERQLVDLNDDCLFALFRYLPLQDLGAIGVTCHQFRNIAVNNVYRYQSSIQQFDIWSMAERYANKVDKNNLAYSVECIKGYLQRFGPIIERIVFDNKMFMKTFNIECTKEIFGAIAKYCGNGLKSLKTRQTNLDLETLSNCHLLFSNLFNLDMDNYFNWPEILPQYGSLKELCLTIERNANTVPFNLAYKFPKLSSFAMHIRDGILLKTREHALMQSQLDLYLNNHRSIVDI